MIAKGYFQTPEKTVDHMVEKLFNKQNPTKKDHVLDAGCGSGDFIDGILRYCNTNRIETPSITGIELDAELSGYAQEKYSQSPQITIIQDDFLLWTGSKFDYVICNPPYVPITELDEEKQLYKPLYRSAVERFDLYMLFIEKALSLLNEDGRLVIITPEKYTYVNTARTLRTLISTYQVTEIEHIPENIFPQQTNYPTITVIDNQKPHTPTQVKPRNGSTIHINIPTDGRSWLPLFNGVNPQQTKHHLEDICDRISCGVATGADRVFIKETKEIDADLLPYTYSSISGRELEYGKPIPEPKYSILIPYDTEAKLIPLNQLGDLRSYLQNEKEQLIKRSCVTKKPWYAFHETPPMESILKPKIICKDVSLTAEFWLDSTGRYFPRHSVYYIVPKKPELLEPIFDYLNSPQVTEWLEQRCQRASNGYYRLQSTVLKKLPIPETLYNLSVR